MKGRSLIPIFLFIYIVLVQPVCAADTGSFHWVGASTIQSNTWSLSGSASATHTNSNSLYFTDQQTLESFQSVIEDGATGLSITGGDGDTGVDTTVTFMHGAQVVGTGIYGYMKMPDGKYRLYVYHWQDWNVTGISAPVRITISTTTIKIKNGNNYAVMSSSPYASGTSVLEYYSNYIYSHLPLGYTGRFNTSTGYNYYNRFTYEALGFTNYFHAYREGFNKSKTIIEINGTEVKNETSLTATDLEWTDPFEIWNITMENQYGDTDTKQIQFVPEYPDASAVIEFNQSFYSSPEVVGVEYDIQNLDIVNYEYWILLTGTNDGIKYFVTNDYYDITTATGQDNFNISYSPLSLPFTMQAELWQYSKVSGESSVLAYSSEVAYNPASLAPGSIWTDKTEYNVGEIVTVSYETVSDSAYVKARKFPKATWSLGEWYIWEVPAGSGSRTFVIPSSGTGDWKVELSESNIIVNESMFSVNETTTPFLAWDDIDGTIGESQLLHFYSDDVNASLQIYDANQIVIYDETVGDGYFENYAISTSTNQQPGTWTASLNCSGSYYNDTVLMYAKDAYVSFNADSYTLGQTITVNYYLKRSTQTIVLYDANNKDVITWTVAGNKIHLGSGSVDFTLSDDNEYGVDIVVGVDANNIKLGLWRLEVLDHGQPIADNPVYDTAKVSRSIDEPADASNEIIKIFFSVEGLFLIFTVCLTMMGLVAAHHPAGGGAGAVVGVGFGVYFNALPVWMLLLMVIALVVLAGVSVAVYFKGRT